MADSALVGLLRVLVSANSAEYETVMKQAGKTAESAGERIAKGLSKAEEGTRGLGLALSRLGGGQVIGHANTLVRAVGELGGVAKLTRAEQEKLNATLTAALEKYQALGREAPAQMRRIATETQAALKPTQAQAFQQQIGNLQNSLSSFASGARTIGLGMTAAFTAPIIGAAAAIGKLGIDAVESFALQAALRYPPRLTFSRVRHMANWARGRDALDVKASPFHRGGVRISTKHEVQRDRRICEAEESALLAACAKLDEPSFHSKLTWKEVDDIRARAAQGESQKSIGEDYGIGSALCSQIVRNRIWNPAMYVPLTCGQEMSDRVIGAFETGGRQGEMQKVQNSDIDWHSHEIKIAKAHTKASVARRIPLTLKGALVRFSGGGDLSEGPRASCSATRPERTFGTSIVCGVK
jgi:hypothetical protein